MGPQDVKERQHITLHVTGVAAILTDNPPHVVDGPVVPDHAWDSTDSPPVTTDASPVHELAKKILSLRGLDGRSG